MENQYTERLKKIEAVLDTWLPRVPDSSWMEKVFGQIIPFGGNSRLREETAAADPAAQGEPVSPELAASLTMPGWDLVNRGGKRWRPLLMVLAAESIAGEKGFDAALPLTPLVEFPHNASLIHDDIEDNSDERRGKPAVHLIYGMDTAINAGSFLFFLPLACLSAWSAGGTYEAGSDLTLPSGSRLPLVSRRIWTTWADHMRAIHLGQGMDIAWHRDFLSLPGLAEYDRMCRLKTGCLARLSAVLGVYSGAAGHSNQQDSGKAEMNWDAIEALAGVFGEAAEKLGVGFQIFDDVKNLCEGIPGKKRGDDIVEGKKSLPVLLYLHRYPEKRDFAARCFAAAREAGTEAPEVEELIAALEAAGILEEARNKGLQYIRESREAFTAPSAAGFPLTAEGRELLAGLIDSLG